MISFNYQNILLWRHAEAEAPKGFEEPDSARPLSKKGLKQAEKMANWLTKNMPKDTIIISSNALRATQTAEALEKKYTSFASIAPIATLEAALRTISGLPEVQHDSLLVIGHQPWLGLLAAQLLSLPKPLPNNAKEISVKKGAVWWFKRPILQKNLPFKLVTVQTPSLL